MVVAGNKQSIHHKKNLTLYSSHVKLIYGAHDQGVWTIGSDLILKERPDSGPKTEVQTLAHLATHTDIDIPVPKVHRHWTDRDGRYLFLRSGWMDKRLRRLGREYRTKRKWVSRRKSLVLLRRCNLSRQTLSRVSTEAHVTRGYYSLISSPADPSTQILTSGTR